MEAEVLSPKQFSVAASIGQDAIPKDLECLIASTKRRMDAEQELLAELDLERIAISEIKTSRQIKMRDRVFQLLREQKLYAYSQISISVGRTRIAIDYSHLSLPHETLGRLLSLRVDDEEVAPVEGEKVRRRKNKRRVSNISVIAFEGLEQAKNALDYIRQKHVHRHMMFDGTRWVVTADKLPDVEVGIKKLEAETVKWLKVAMHSYNRERDAYLRWLGGWLHSVSQDLERIGEEPLDIKSIFPLYVEKFPTRQQIKDSVKLIVVGPIEQPSLRDQAAQDAEMREQLARYEQAGLDMERTECVRAAFRREMQLREESVSRGAAYIENQVFEAVKSLIDQAEGILAKGEKSSITPKKRELIDRALEQVESLLEIPGLAQIGELIPDSQTLGALCRQGQAKRAEIQVMLDRVKDSISKEFEYTPTAHGTGSRVVPTRLRVLDDEEN